MAHIRITDPYYKRFRGLFEDALEEDVADRETIVSSGNWSDVNTAITAMNAAGGGIVRLDGLFDYDVDLVMKSNVILMGYGSGTGLTNTGAGAAVIGFEGTTPTWREIGLPSDGADQFTCDTVGEATDFVIGGYGLMRDSGGSRAWCGIFKTKTTGDGGTGVVELYGNIRNPASWGTATSQAGVLTGVGNSGVMLCDIDNTGAGSITVNVQYAHNVVFERTNFYECATSIDHSGLIDFRDCIFDVRNIKTHAAHIDLVDMLDRVTINGCTLNGAIKGVGWSGSSSALCKLNIENCTMNSRYQVDLDPTVNTKALIEDILILNNKFIVGEDPGSAGGASRAIRMDAYVYFGDVSDNYIRNNSSSYQIEIDGANFSSAAVSRNAIDQGGMELLAASNVAVVENVVAGLMLFDNGPSNCTITGNNGSSYMTLRTGGGRRVTDNVVSGNVVAGGCYATGTAALSFDNNTITGNKFSLFSGPAFSTDTTMTGNFFTGQVTFASAASDSALRLVFSNNTLELNCTFGEPDQDDCTITNNQITGTLTYLTGTGNKVEQAGHYSIQDREIRLATGGSTEINAAITTLNAAGGGKVILDATLSMDGDITMLSNVILEGQGPGTGLTNSTGNAYEINFQGAITDYAIGAVTKGADQFITDTAAEAANFTEGEWFIFKDDTTTHRQTFASKVKVDGVAGTGVVEFYGSPAESMNAASTSGPLSNMSFAGIESMDVTNTSTGSIEVDIDYAHNLNFRDVYFEETSVSIGESAVINFDGCKFECEDDLAFAYFVDFLEWVNLVRFDNCNFLGALIAARANISKVVKFISFNACRFSGCDTVWDTTSGATNNAQVMDLSFVGCEFSFNEDPSSGGGSSYGINGNCQFSGVGVVGCTSRSEDFTPIRLLAPSGSFIYDLIVSGNQLYDLGITAYGVNRGAITGNISRTGAISITRGCTETSISANGRLSSITLSDTSRTAITKNTIAGNVIDGALYIGSDSTRVSLNNAISGNYCASLTFEEDVTDTVVDGNVINGNVSIGGGAGDVLDRLVFSNNNVDGTVTFSEADTDYNIVIGNTTNGAITDISDGVGGGTGNVLEHNTVY